MSTAAPPSPDEVLGGFALPMDAACRSIELMAGGCLSTAFIWIQHHGVVLSVAYTAPDELRDRFLAPLCAGDVREALDLAAVDDMPAARAAGSALAGRASHALIASRGSSSILLDQHGQRLARESLFLLVFGSRPRIRRALLDQLGATSPDPST